MHDQGGRSNEKVWEVEQDSTFSSVGEKAWRSRKELVECEGKRSTWVVWNGWSLKCFETSMWFPKIGLLYRSQHIWHMCQYQANFSNTSKVLCWNSLGYLLGNLRGVNVPCDQKRAKGRKVRALTVSLIAQPNSVPLNSGGLVICLF